MKRQKMILRRTVPDSLEAEGWVNKTEEFEVLLLAIADGYAMVRRKGCVPFVEDTKNLIPIVEI